MRDSSEVAFNLQAECNRLNSELSALREENERLKSESFEELYNAAIDERDAMREELARSKELTMSMANRANQFEEERDAAEQRNAELVELLREARQWVDRNSFHGIDALDLMARIDALTKPTESGASHDPS